MDADLDTLATALYVRTDDLLKAWPEHAPARPHVGFTPRLTDAELVTLAVMQALLGRTSEARDGDYRAGRDLAGLREADGEHVVMAKLSYWLGG